MAKQFLKEGDEMVADFVSFTMNEKHMLINPMIGEATLWHDGVEVHRDEASEQLYIEIDDETNY